MSKNHSKDYQSLDINKEINQELGKIKNTKINYIYARISKNSKGKNEKHGEKSKKNKSGQKLIYHPAIMNKILSEKKIVVILVIIMTH